MTQRAGGQIPKISLDCKTQTHTHIHTHTSSGEIFRLHKQFNDFLVFFFDHVMHKLSGLGTGQQSTWPVEALACFYIADSGAGGCRRCCSENSPLGMVSSLGPELYLPGC